jgi:hypothetical protein
VIVDRDTLAQHVLQRLENAGRCERFDAGAAAADWHGGIGHRPDDGYPLQRLPVERQEMTFVLQQDHALARGVERRRPARRVVERNRCVRLLAVEPAEAGGDTKDATDLLVDRRRRDGAGLNRG